VRGKRARGDRRIEGALAALQRALREARVPWTVIGGIAVIARGVRRTTSDIDALVRGDAISAGDLVRILKRHKIVPRIADAVEFADENLVLLVRHAETEVNLDVSFGWTSFEHEAVSDPVRTRFGHVVVPMASADDLIILKLVAGRPKDIQDCTALLALYPKIDLERVRHKVGELADAAGEPALVDGFAEIMARSRGTTRRRSAKRKPRKR